jgi:hypothetical protein
MKTNISAENSVKTENAGRGRWLRTALLAYTLAGPAISAWIKKRASQGSQAVATVAQAIPAVAQSRQADFRERLEELTRESRQRAIEQAQHMRAQASQLQSQSRQLRKAVREEAKQRRKLLAQMRDSGLEWGQDMLKRGEHLTGELVERGGEMTHDLAKRGGEMTHDLAKRGGEMTHDLAKRDEEMTHDLAKRGRKATRTLAKRSEELLVPAYEQNRVLWTVAGFGVGLVVAGAITYRLVRGRAIRQAREEDQAIELPQVDSWNGKVAHPAGEILHFDLNGATVATLEAVSVANAERPENAAFVGIISTQSYYPVDTELEFSDLVYFFSEEEARARGFKAAE